MPTSDRMVVNGTPYMIMDSEARAALDTYVAASSGVGIFSEAQAEAYSEYADLNTAPTDKVFTIGRDGIPYCSHYPMDLMYGATFITFGYMKDGGTSGCVQMGVSLDNRINLTAIRAKTDSWGPWRYSDSVEDALETATFTDGGILDKNSWQIIYNQYTTTYKVSDYIPVSFGDIINIGYVDGLGRNCPLFCYDADKEPLFVLGADQEYRGPFAVQIIDRRVAYVRNNVWKNAQNNYLRITTPNVLPADISEIRINGQYGRSYELNVQGLFPTIRAAADYIKTYGVRNATVFCEAGTYNLVTELADVIGESYDGDRYSHGIQFGWDAHWIFAEGAYLKFLYNGSNVDVANLFSPLVIAGGCHLEGMDIEAANCQYCVHDDWPVRESNWIVRYTDCRMKHNGNTIGTYATTVCIGGGLLPNETVIVEGGRYECPAAFNYPISYHTIWADLSSSYPSRIIFRDVWISGGFRLQDSEWDCNDVDVTITGCSQGAGIGGTHTFFTITEWNNEIRN